MENQLIVLGIILLLLIVGLSGCDEQSDNEISSNADKIELVSYSVQTELGPEVADGFVNEEDADRYIVRGTLKNIANENLTNVSIIANFYDSNNNFLNSETDFIGELVPDESWDFLFVYVYGRDFHLVYADYVEFDIIIDNKFDEDTDIDFIQPDEVKLIGDIESVGIINCTIEAHKYDYDLDKYVKTADGFTYSEDVSRYFVSITFKNIVGKMIWSFVINYRFYGNNDSMISGSYIEKSNIAASQIWTFDFICTASWGDDLSDVEHLELDISAISIP